MGDGVPSEPPPLPAPEVAIPDNVNAADGSVPVNTDAGDEILQPVAGPAAEAAGESLPWPSLEGGLGHEAVAEAAAPAAHAAEALADEGGAAEAAAPVPDVEAAALEAAAPAAPAAEALADEGGAAEAAAPVPDVEAAALEAARPAEDRAAEAAGPRPDVEAPAPVAPPVPEAEARVRAPGRGYVNFWTDVNCEVCGRVCGQLKLDPNPGSRDPPTWYMRVCGTNGSWPSKGPTFKRSIVSVMGNTDVRVRAWIQRNRKCCEAAGR